MKAPAHNNEWNMSNMLYISKLTIDSTILIFIGKCVMFVVHAGIYTASMSRREHPTLPADE